MRKYRFICLLFIPLYSSAQFELGIGPQLNFPLMYNNMVGGYHHSLGSFGLCATINYVPNTTSFYPSLSINGALAILPILKVDNTIVSMRFLQTNIGLSAKTKRQFKKGELNYGLGLEASYFSGESIETSGANNDMNIYKVDADSNFINIWMPAIHITLEYVIPISAKRPWYAGLGFNLQYIHFFDRNTKYTISVSDNQYHRAKYNVDLNGEMFTPGFYVSFYYKLGQNAYNY